MSYYHRELINTCGENSEKMLLVMNKMYEIYLSIDKHNEAILNT